MKIINIFKNKKGALAKLIVEILLIIIAVFLVGSYRVNIAQPTNNVIKSGNSQVLEMDKALYNKD